MIPVPQVEAPILDLVIAYCEYFRKQSLEDMSADDADKWEKDFVDVPKAKLFALIRASNFLDIQTLLDLTCKTVADMLKGKTADIINEEFRIPKGEYLY